MSPSPGDPSLLPAARAAAIAAAAAIPAAHTDSVAFTSRGVVLVTGEAGRVLATLAQLPPPLRVVAFVPDAADDIAPPTNVRMVAAPILSLTGHLGCFSATTVPVNGETIDAGRFGWNDDRHFDLVLDLNGTPLLTREVAPYGYYAPHTEVELEAALAGIRGQPEHWSKPRYFDYHSELCAHAAAGVVGCTRCLDTCPADAIASAGDKLRFDPFLCQGCGTCTAVCPDGAVRYAFPSAGTTIDRLHAMLTAWLGTGASPPTVVVSPVVDQRVEVRETPAAPSDSLAFPVHALASFGIEAWFAALAWGAAQVVLVPDSTTDQASLRALDAELLVAQAILSALGEDTGRIALTNETGQFQALPGAGMGAVAGAISRESKRSTLYAALDHLSRGRAQSSAPIPLPPQASFGIVEVNKDRCTLCFACVNLCPTNALTRGDTALHELRFTESRCVQCGLCEHGCPERAIGLIAQIQAQHAVREESRVLCTDEPFTCVQCGAPFISKRMLLRSMEMMKDHPLLQQEGIERLKLCLPCRAQATMQDAMSDGG